MRSMDINYSIGLNVLLRHLAIKPLLDRVRDGEDLGNIKNIFPLNEFAVGCLEVYPQYSYNECENIYKKFIRIVDAYEKAESEYSIYSLFYKIAEKALTLEGSGVACRHSELLSWRETIHSIGQSIFICAFLAHEDIAFGNNRINFAFSPYATSDNMRLRNMLSLGMAENHFHLKGSTPAFLMSWVCLMNHISGRNTEGNDFKHKAMQNRFFRNPAKDESLSPYKTTEIAAWIRFWLNRWLDDTFPKDVGCKNVSQLLNKILNGTPHIWVDKLQEKISVERKFIKSRKYDYASNEDDSTKTYSPISGEHRFLYRMFREIYSNRREDIKTVYLPFFIYLLSYMRLRSELVQCNTAIGFHNFEKYQERKDIFVERHPIYKDAYVKMALNSALRHRFIHSLEARFYPSTNYKSLYETIIKFHRMSTEKETTLYKLLKKTEESFPEKRLEKVLIEINPEEKKLKEKKETEDQKLFFVPFLVKQPDNSSQGEARKRLGKYAPIDNRHYKLQSGEYRQQIENIIRLRQSDNPYAQSIYGIDACNNEVHARPEVFAFLFRKARYTSVRTPFSEVRKKDIAKLRITYHAGEDFFDIVSGLRAIDETIIFMELTHGDRLGHALALGIEPEDFYSLKSKRVFLPRQELLDNLVWLSHSLHKYGLFDSALESWLDHEIEEHFQWIFPKEELHTDKLHEQHHTVNLDRSAYIKAWYLRGDNPKYYADIKNDKVFLRKIRQLEIVAPWELLSNSHSKAIREKNIQARQIMHLYHYNPVVRNEGEKIVEFKIHDRYPKIVRDLQDAMLQYVCLQGIGIETNPSSNYLIGTFKNYHKHPIVRFYNRWLNPASTSPQAFVSINTDDQGVFDTDLENEYALMASALENAMDENGTPLYKSADIIQWLDDIRKMGLEQSFMLMHKNLTEGR